VIIHIITIDSQKRKKQFKEGFMKASATEQCKFSVVCFEQHTVIETYSKSHIKLSGIHFKVGSVALQSN